MVDYTFKAPVIKYRTPPSAQESWIAAQVHSRMPYLSEDDCLDATRAVLEAATLLQRRSETPSDQPAPPSSEQSQAR